MSRYTQRVASLVTWAQVDPWPMPLVSELGMLAGIDAVAANLSNAVFQKRIHTAVSESMNETAEALPKGVSLRFA
jgi:hypothetical protein